MHHSTPKLAQNSLDAASPGASQPIGHGGPTPLIREHSVCAGASQTADWTELGQRVLAEALRRVTDDLAGRGFRSATPDARIATKGAQ